MTSLLPESGKEPLPPGGGICLIRLILCHHNALYAELWPRMIPCLFLDPLGSVIVMRDVAVAVPCLSAGIAVV